MSRSARIAVWRAFLAACATMLFVLAAGAGTEGCRNATQVTIELRTVGSLPCNALLGVAIVVARTPKEAEEKMALGSFSAEVARGQCEADGSTIGTLAITPFGTTGAVMVKARYTDVSGNRCAAPDYKGCIVARRAFAFVDHASVTLPISLEVACVDVPCDVETSCRNGVCVSSTAECSESSATCVSPAEPTATDGGTVVPSEGGPGHDAATSDGANDSGARDAGIDAAVVDGGTTYGSTNICPYQDGAVSDCTELSLDNVCCGHPLTGWQCETKSTCTPAGGTPSPSLACTGAKHCPANTWCCGYPAGGGTSSCQPGCMAQFLCSTNADCPPPKICSQMTGPTAGGRGLRLCQ
jgi:hypothetical protein